MSNTEKVTYSPKVEDLYVIDDMIVNRWDNIVNKESKLIDEIICQADLMGIPLDINDVQNIKLIKRGVFDSNEANFFKRLKLMAKLGIEWHLLVTVDGYKDDCITFDTDKRMRSILYPTKERGDSLKYKLDRWVVNNKVLIISHQIVGEFLSQASKVTATLRTSMKKLSKMNIKSHQEEVDETPYLTKYLLSEFVIKIAEYFNDKENIDIGYDTFLVLLKVYEMYVKDKSGVGYNLEVVTVYNQLSSLINIYQNRNIVATKVSILVDRGYLIKRKIEKYKSVGGKGYAESLHITSSGIQLVDTILCNICNDAQIFK